MNIHLYTRCWNDADMLPFFFRHYDDLVSRYVVYDDGSTDDSLKILASHPRTEIRHQPKRKKSVSYIDFQTALQNEFWKESRSKADWVIITDIDEHLYHRDMTGYLSSCLDAGVTVIPSLGYHMVAREFPEQTGHMYKLVRTGAPHDSCCKLNIINPSAVTKSAFWPGRHRALPEGRIVAPATDEMLLLHFHYIGFERVKRRHQLYRTRLSERDVNTGRGRQYALSEAGLAEAWSDLEARSVDVTDPDLRPSESYPGKRWWNYMPRASEPGLAKDRAHWISGV